MPRGQPFTVMCQRLAQLRAESRRADLHLHTTHSDGLFSPAEVVRRAAERGLGAIAVTDHDTCSGYAEAAAIAKGLEVIAGVEITCEFRERELHLLGYFIDPDEPTLAAALAQLRAQRLERFAAMLDRLAAAGVHFDEEVRQTCLTRGHSLGRRELAVMLMRGGHVSTISGAFAKYLRDEGPIALPKRGLPVGAAIALVRGAGGVSSYAHPPQDIDLIRVQELRDMGLDALEAVYPTFTSARERMVRDLARQAGLAISGGSDCHGPTPASRGVGVKGVTRLELDMLRRRVEKRESSPAVGELSQ